MGSPPPKEEPPLLFTVREVAEQLRLSKRAAYRIVRNMKRVEIGGRILVPATALADYIAARMQQPEVWANVPTRRKQQAAKGKVGSDTSSRPAWLKPITPRTAAKR